jgi:glycosyltransferase involved in cell wall biosynthesis
LRVAIDTKNFALYNGGIAHWFAPLLASWITHRKDVHFLLLGPDFQMGFLPNVPNWEHVPLAWPTLLPRPLRHPWYDNVLFPRALTRLKPDVVMSPYHDVRMPSTIPSAITVHDLCLDELNTIYPRRVRLYYLWLLRSNLKRASMVVTVSESSRNRLIQRYGLALERVAVIYNSLPSAFDVAAQDTELVSFRCTHAGAGGLLLYPGGSEFRKNTPRLVQAFALLAQQDQHLTLLVTGSLDPRWQAALEQLSGDLSSRVKFAGHLTDHELGVAYRVADAVVYPSLCEGFGRVCLEALETGAPLACSDLPVMREVAGLRAHYFDPLDVVAMAAAIREALAQGRVDPVKDARFQADVVASGFLKSMDAFVANACV